MTGPARLRRRLSGRLRVALPPDEAFHLFTPHGEREWVPGWEPRFPAPADDDSAPGTVFQTDAVGHTATWVVADRTWGQRIAYTRVVPGVHAGTVTVTLDGAGDVTVTYDITSLSAAGDEWLGEFAAGYPEFLRGWQDAIEASLATRHS